MKYIIENIVFIIVIFCYMSHMSAYTFDLDKTIGKKNLIDILIIGSGPAGLSAAIHGSRAQLKTLIIEGKNPGGQLMNTAIIENYPGCYPKVSGPELIKDLRTQAKSFGTKFVSDFVTNIDFSSWPYKIYTEKRKIFHAMTIVFATGVSPENLGDVPGANEYYGKGVSHCAIADGPRYKNKKIIVIGGGDTAVSEVSQLAPYAKEITVLVRSDKMRAAQILQDQLEDFSNVTVKYNTSIKKIVGNNSWVTGAQLCNNVTDKCSNPTVSGIFIAIGNKPNTQLIANELALDKEGYVISHGPTQETSIPGVFVAGDILAGKLKQVATAVGSGSQAGFDAVRFLIDVVGIMKRKNFDYLVCFCKKISYVDIVKAIRSGCKTFSQLRKKLSVCGGCGACKQKVMEILRKELKKLQKDE